METTSTCRIWFLLQLLIILSLHGVSSDDDELGGRSIIFNTLGRSQYDFDIYSLPIQNQHSPTEIRVTDGNSVNFNGHFLSPSSSSFLLSLLLNQSQIQVLADTPPLQLVYVTERNGISNIYYDVVSIEDQQQTRKRSILEAVSDRVQVPLFPESTELSDNRVSMKDKPTVTGEHLVYVSTHENPGKPRASWAAVYSTHLKSGLTLRLTPYGVADFSPAVSPSGLWTAVASYGEKAWDGDVEELATDIYVFLTRDGTQRVKVVEHGGWPAWVDDTTFYYHRRGDDGWWSIYRAILPSQGSISTESVTIQRVTPPGLHAFTPATSPGNHKFIALATRRPSSDFRHIELFYMETNEFKQLSRHVSPSTHHFNPFISPDSNRVGYHKCAGAEADQARVNNQRQLVLENIRSPVPGLSVFRFDGSFPSFSPTGDRIAYVRLPGIYIVRPDGSNYRQVSGIRAFPTAWDPVRKGIIYTSAGPEFAPVTTEVDIIAINVDDDSESGYRRLTTNGQNNAFPSPSPDGKWIVFRSGRSGHKNLYIMDAEHGESGGLRRLTEGAWTDTMCNWSPDGEWIAFSSDRDNPGSGSFVVYMIHPNGTGLRKVLQSGLGGRVNHPNFSPDGKKLTFTSDYGGVSAEPISNPHHYQPYGEIFTMNIDGSELMRLTHNSFEDGTPTWSPKYLKPSNVVWAKGRDSYCDFDDCHWLNNKPSASFQVAYAAKVYVNKTECGV